MTALDWVGVGCLVGLVLTVVLWWRWDIRPQLRKKPGHDTGQ